MTLAICLSDNGGRLFNGRRQSRDTALIEDLIELTDEMKLIASPFSEKLFPEGKVEISECSFDKIEGDFVYFDETTALSDKSSVIDRLIVYRWNREYPSDINIDIDIDSLFEMTDSREFAGKSHDKITREIYVKRQ